MLSTLKNISVGKSVPFQGLLSKNRKNYIHVDFKIQGLFQQSDGQT